MCSKMRFIPSSRHPEAVETIYTRYGDTYRNGDYVMHRYYDGSHALYRIMKEMEATA